MNYLTENWSAFALGGFVFLMLAVLIAMWLRHRRILGELAAQLMDERQGRVRISFIAGAVVTGHYHGRWTKLSLREAKEGTESQLTLELSCSVPSSFLADRPRSVAGRLFGLDPGMVAEQAGAPGSFGFMLERSGWMPRRLLGIDMGGGTGLPLAPIGDPAFDESFCLSAAEPARDAVVTWMRRPECKEQVETLFSAEGLAFLTPTRDSNGEVFLATAVSRPRDTGVESENVRSLLNQLEGIAKSLETQKPIAH